MTCHLHAEREPEAHSAQAGPFQSQTINCWANYKLRAGRARRRLTPTPFSFKPSDDNNIAPPLVHPFLDVKRPPSPPLQYSFGGLQNSSWFNIFGRLRPQEKKNQA